MKILMPIVVFFILLSGCNQTSEFKTDEIIFYVEMTVNNKSSDEIEVFSRKYQELVMLNEPDTLSWKFFKSSSDEVIEISRWNNSEAIKTHISNISSGGILEGGFISFVDHFVINKISVLGKINPEVREMLDNLGIPIIYRPLISGYSR
ncbi:MAG: hypothetical protein P8H21_00780 [Woeseiaceae bacterium]|nr:hypothetical protein [Woeseiaceae bacterium]